MSMAAAMREVNARTTPATPKRLRGARPGAPYGRPLCWRSATA